MKKFLQRHLFALICAVSTVGACFIVFGCSTAPASRVSAVQTLKAVGETAEAAVTTTAQLYASGQITAAQAHQVTDTYDNKFQPAYRVAVTAVNSNLDVAAPDDLVALSLQLSALVLTFSQKK